MADVDVRGHDGDGHGDPPPGGWDPASGCAAVGPPKVRKMTTNKGLRKRWEKNGCQPFPIVFDFEDQQTMRPVGPNSRDFVNLLGVTIRTTVPLTYNSWRDVPDEARTAILPQLETYFNLSPYLDHPGYKTPFEAGIMKLSAELYSGAKARFKKKNFTKLGGTDKIDAIRQRIPAGWTPEKWNEMVNSYSSEDNIHRSAVNSNNRSFHRYKSYHGTRSIVETRHDRHEIDGKYPSLIQDFKERCSKNGKIPLSSTAQQQYDAMKDLLSQQESAVNPLTEEQIMDQVLGSRRGFKRGRGHIIPGMARYHAPSSSPGPCTPPPPVYTQEQVDEKLASTKRKYARLSTQMKDLVKGLAEHDIVIDVESDHESDSD